MLRPFTPPLIGTVGIGGAVWPYKVEHSALFDGVNDYLSFTPASVGNRKKWTFSAWVKDCEIGTAGGDLLAVYDGANQYTVVRLNTDGKIVFLHDGGTPVFASDGIFVDSSNSFHLVVHVDTTQAVANDRIKMYVNGNLLSGTYTGVPAQNSDLRINSTSLHAIGRLGSVSSVYFNGYLSEFHLLDDQNPSPDTLGEFSSVVSGLWVPKAYTGTYGTNGSHLDFADAANLGKDASGNGNDWTVNGGPVQAVDTPTNNHCTLNPHDHRTTGTLSNGNLTTDGNATITMRPSSGQWYYEKDGVGVSYDADVNGQFDPVLTAGTYNFGATSWSDTGPTGSEKALNAESMPSGDYVTSGSYTGNGSALYVYTGCALDSVTIGANTYINDGTETEIEFYANGFMLTGATDNANGTNYNWSGVLRYSFKTSNAQSN